MTDAVLGTTLAEVIHGGSPKAQIATTVGEVIHKGNPQAQIATSFAEVLYSNVGVVRAVLPRRIVVTITH